MWPINVTSEDGQYFSVMVYISNLMTLAPTMWQNCRPWWPAAMGSYWEPRRRVKITHKRLDAGEIVRAEGGEASRFCVLAHGWQITAFWEETDSPQFCAVLVPTSEDGPQCFIPHDECILGELHHEAGVADGSNPNQRLFKNGHDVAQARESCRQLG